MKKQDGRNRPLKARLLDEPVRRITVRGVDFDEEFLAHLVTSFLRESACQAPPTLEDAYRTYLENHLSGNHPDFLRFSDHYFSRFSAFVGDMGLFRLRHSHVVRYRDALIDFGLQPNTVRRHMRTLKAIVGYADRHYGIERTNPFAKLMIKGEGYVKKVFPSYDKSLLLQAKKRLLKLDSPSALVGLILLNTGMRVSEPSLAKLDDLVLDHDVPHLWIRRNEVASRKTIASIRSIPLLGVSLTAAKRLRERALAEGSEWLVPTYGRYGGHSACTLSLNYALKPLGMRSHMFRHAFVDRLRSIGSVDMTTASVLLGHSRGRHQSIHNYGWVSTDLGYQAEIITQIVI